MKFIPTAVKVTVLETLGHRETVSCLAVHVSVRLPVLVTVYVDPVSALRPLSTQL